MHYVGMMPFWDRKQELSKIKGFIGKGAFGYVTGRRRVGKTTLLLQACENFGGIYHQAVEGTPGQQLLHAAEELKNKLPVFGQVAPKNWVEFFALLSKEKLPRLLVFDEFPYWVQGDPSLPSILQKWIDHELPGKKTFVCVSGSSQSMLYSQFLNQASPLYGRALIHIHLEQMPFKWFCRALNYRTDDPASFERYSIVGGVPHYWKLMPSGSLLEQVNRLYFEPSAILSEEPKNLIQDENITGTIPKAILDLIGRGVSKPSELASRLGTVQGNLSRPLALLLDSGVICRELPFGESSRTTKRVLYSIHDSALSFYYGIYLPFRGHWHTMTEKEKKNVLNLHISRQWEIFCRSLYPGSSRYWEGDVELDLVARHGGKNKYLISECKWMELSKNEEKNLLEDLKSRFLKTKLSKKLADADFKIFSKKDLSSLPQ
jgi:AAA+ ATPase superfamily predicted ATPase